MKKISVISIGIVLIFVMLTGCGSSNLDVNNNETTMSTDISTEKQTLEQNNEYLSDGVVNGTNAKNIEETLKGNSSYNWWVDHNLTQSQINKEWSVYCANNEYNTYTKSYDLYAEENFEIEIAKFATYDNDMDYIMTCVDFFDTDYINIDEVKQWILDYKSEDGYVTKIFGDAEFVLDTEEDYESIKFELSVYALD